MELPDQTEKEKLLRRLEICESYHDNLIDLADVIVHEDAAQVAAFLLLATCFLEPGEERMKVIGRLNGEVGLCPLLPEDAALNPVIARHVSGDPCYNGLLRTIMLPPPHDLHRVTQTALYMHEGTHALEAAWRNYRPRPEDGISGHEELRAYRVGSAAVAALYPDIYRPSIDQIKGNIRARSTFPEDFRNGFDLAWDNVAQGVLLLSQPDFSERDKIYLRTTLKFSAMDELLSEQYPGDPAIEQAKADFIRRIYDQHDALEA